MFIYKKNMIPSAKIRKKRVHSKIKIAGKNKNKSTLKNTAQTQPSGPA
jgi:hypothetical protein